MKRSEILAAGIWAIAWIWIYSLDADNTKTEKHEVLKASVSAINSIQGQTSQNVKWIEWHYFEISDVVPVPRPMINKNAIRQWNELSSIPPKVKKDNTTTPPLDLPPKKVMMQCPVIPPKKNPNVS